MATSPAATNPPANPAGHASRFAADAALRHARLLIVDDELSTTRFLEGLLRRAGYRHIEVAHTVERAMARCRARTPDLLLLDVHMRDADGLDLLAELRPDVVRSPGAGLFAAIVITGDATPATRERVARLGAEDFVSKPFEGFELLLRIESLLLLRFLHQDRFTGSVGKAVLGDAGLGRSELAFIDRLVEVSQYFESARHGHNDRVGQLSAAIAREYGMSAAEAAALGRAARLHDIGKIGVRDEILGKPGRLTACERELAQRHTLVGGLMLAGSRLPLLRLAEEIALSHHERWDGSGYPFAMSCTDIPLSGRIVAVADTFDAMTHERPYRTPRTVRTAIDEIESLRGVHFDPDVVAAFQTAVAQELRAGPAVDAPQPVSTPRRATSNPAAARRGLRRLGLVGAAQATVPLTIV